MEKSDDVGEQDYHDRIVLVLTIKTKGGREWTGYMEVFWAERYTVVRCRHLAVQHPGLVSFKYCERTKLCYSWQRCGSVYGNRNMCTTIIMMMLSDLILYSPVVTICTASLTFSNSTFFPHSVFMCFVWI